MNSKKFLAVIILGIFAVTFLSIFSKMETVKAVPSEQIANGGFEDDFNGWTNWYSEISTSEYHSGLKSCYQTYSNHLTQTLDVKINDIASFTVWIKKGSGNGYEYFTFTSDAGGQNYRLPSTLNGYDWTQIDLLAEMQSQGAYGTLTEMGFTRMDDNFVAYWIDDVSLMADTANPPLPLFEDFENWNVNGWSINGDVEITAEAAYAGTFGLKIAGSDNADIWHPFSEVEHSRVEFFFRPASFGGQGTTNTEIFWYGNDQGNWLELLLHKQDSDWYFRYVSTEIDEVLTSAGTIDQEYWYKWRIDYTAEKRTVYITELGAGSEIKAIEETGEFDPPNGIILGALGFDGSPSFNLFYDDILVYETSDETPPTIGDFQAPSTVYANKYFLLNATVDNPNGVAGFINATVELSNNVVLKWIYSTDTFSIHSDPSGYATIDPKNSLRTSVNDTAYKLSWRIKLGWAYPEGAINIVAANTKVFSTDGSGDNSHSALFTFENDLVMYAASVDGSRVNPAQSITFSGTLHYQGTTLPPEDVAGITAKVELARVLKGSTTTINGNGQFTITFNGESAIAQHDYVVYATTVKNTAQNQTVPVVVDRMKVDGYAFSDSRTNIGENVNIDVTLVYEYDSAVVTTGTININGYSATHIGSGVYRITRTSPAVTIATFNSVAGSETTYGLNTVNQNGKSASVIWDRLQITYASNTTAPKANEVVSFVVTAIYEYDSATVTFGYINTQRNGTYLTSSVAWTDVSADAVTYQYTVLNASDNAFGITAFAANTVTVSWSLSVYTLNVHTLDAAGNPLYNTTVLMNNGTLHVSPTVNGQVSYSGILPGTMVRLNVTWLFSDLYVNDTFTITVTEDTTLNIVCRAWPFDFNGATRHIGTDRNVTSASWLNNRFTLTFENSSSSNSIAFNTGRIPTYILNMSYNAAASWNSTSGVFRGSVENTTSTVTVALDNWGDFYVQRVDDKLASLNWTGQKLVISISRNASGTIALHCGSRGIPESTSGLTAASYSTTTKIFQATYAASGIVEVDWGSNPQDPQVPPPPVVSFSALTEALGKLKPGDTKTFKITVTFSSSSFTINSLTFTGAARSWCKTITSLPVTFVRVDPSALEGTGELEVSVTIPGNTGSGNHTGTAVIYGVDPFGTLHETTLSLSFMVETSLPMGSWDFDWGAVDMNMTAGMIMIVALVIVAFAVFVKKKSR